MALLPIIWAMIIAFAIVMYVILDGYTLGVGMLLPLLSHDQRSIATTVLLPTWDGNQTWLVLGTASLYGAFPLAFSSILPIFYLPIFVLLMALLLRGVIFEFRLKSEKRGQRNWDIIFAIASLVVALCQGLVLGDFIQGFQQTNVTQISFGHFFITPFSLTCAIGLVVGYTLLGSTRLILKTTGELQNIMYRYARTAIILVMVGMAAVSIWTPFIDPHVFHRWFTGHHWMYLMSLPLLTAVAVCVLLYSLWKRFDATPYWASIGVFLCGYIGFIISIFPFIIPYKVTIWQAAAPANTLSFLLVGAAIMLPILLVYTGYSYHIFKGKVTSATEDY